MKLYKKIIALSLAIITLLTCALTMGACTQKVSVTFVQEGYENQVVSVKKGTSLKSLSKPKEATDKSLITEWNAKENFVIEEDVIITAISYTEGLSFEEGTHLGKTSYAVVGYKGSHDKVVIPEFYRGGSVRSIKTQVFQRNLIIKEVVLPESLVSMGVYAFYGAKNLTKINIPSSLTNLQSHVFGDTSIQGPLSIPEGVEEVGLRAFWAADFTFLNTNNVKKAGQFAFGGQQLKTIVWDVNLTTVYDNTFYMQPVEEIFYTGDESDWAEVEFLEVDYEGTNANSKYGATEKLLQEATIYFYLDWEYVDGVPTPIN